MSDDARALLRRSAGNLPQIPRLTGRDDVTDKIKALKPDLILDYGTVSPRYVELAQTTQQQNRHPDHSAERIRWHNIPRYLRSLGGILHREDRAETLAGFAEALLALPATPSVSIRASSTRVARMA